MMIEFGKYYGAKGVKVVFGPSRHGMFAFTEGIPSDSIEEMVNGKHSVLDYIFNDMKQFRFTMALPMQVASIH